MDLDLIHAAVDVALAIPLVIWLGRRVGWAIPIAAIAAGLMAAKLYLDLL